MISASACGVSTSEWIVLPVENIQGSDVPLALVRIDLAELEGRLDGDPSRITVYGEGREPLHAYLAPATAPTHLAVFTPLPAAGLRLTLVNPGADPNPLSPTRTPNRWAAEVDYDGAHR